MFLCLTPVLVMKRKCITAILIALSHFRGRVVVPECLTCGTWIIAKTPIDKEDSVGKLGLIMKMN